VRLQASEQGADDLPSRDIDFNEIEVGQIVEIENLGMGEVLELPSGSLSAKTLILVQVGEIKTRVTCDRLKKVSGQRGRNYRKNKVAHEKAREPKIFTLSSTSATGSVICDVRGKTVEDALRKVDQSLNMLLGGASVITIIHGHGTSKLREAIRDYLSNKRKDIVFRAGEWPGEGGDGVTLAELS